MLYTTKKGLKLQVVKIDRRKIDSQMGLLEPPVPPSQDVEVFGGITEQIPDYKDEKYLEEVSDYYLILFKQLVDVLVEGIIVLDESYFQTEEFLELSELFPNQNRISYTVFSNQEDTENLIELILYLSTVTPKGIEEARNKFNARFLDQDVHGWKLPEIPVEYSAIFRDMKVAKEFNLTWDQFCALSGLEQSTLVCQSQLEGTLDYLIQKWMSKK